MNILSSSYDSTMMQQMQQTQRKEPPSAEELADKIMEASDANGDSLLSIDELNISEELFENMDEDGDGTLSNSEILNSLSSMLEDMKNKKTSPQEFGQLLSDMGLDVPPPPPPMGGMPDTSKMAADIFSSKDTDSDALLSIEELDISEELFATLDTDEDGSISEDELAQGLTVIFESVQNGEMSKDEAGEVLSQLGLEKPQGNGQPMGGGAGGGDSSEEEYEDADTNQDGVVSAAEYAAYYGSSNDDMANYTVNLVSTLIDALKTEAQENETDESIDLSQFKQIMTMVNEQIQDPKTSEILDKYISQI